MCVAICILVKSCEYSFLSAPIPLFSTTIPSVPPSSPLFLLSSLLPIDFSLHHLPSLQNVMKDKWMNVGYEEEELKPYLEPTADLDDPARIREYTAESLQMAVSVFLYLYLLSFYTFLY